MNYQESIKRSKEFFDTVNFEKFFPKDKMVSIESIMSDIDDFYYERPDLLPKDFHGEFFNFVDKWDFLDYLKKRYGWETNTEVIEVAYIMRN